MIFPEFSPNDARARKVTVFPKQHRDHQHAEEAQKQFYHNVLSAKIARPYTKQS